MIGNPMTQLSQTVDDAMEKLRKTLLEIHGKNFNKSVDVYAYTRRFSAVANGATPTDAFQINAGSTFIWTGSSASVRDTALGIPSLTIQGALTGGSGVPSWPFRIEITDGGDNDQLQSDAVHLQSMFGDVATQGPIPLLRPRVWAPNSTVQIKLNRFSAGQVDQTGAAVNRTMDVDLIFIGYRIKIANMQNLTSDFGS